MEPESLRVGRRLWSIDRGVGSMFLEVVRYMMWQVAFRNSKCRAQAVSDTRAFTYSSCRTKLLFWACC